MITKTAHGYFKAFTVLLALGIIFGNVNLLLLGVMLLSFFLLGLNVGEPRDVAAQRAFNQMTPRVGDEVDVTIHVRAERGTGFIEVYDEVPELFELVRGSNIHLLWKGLGAPAEATYTYTVRCTKRGVYDLAPSALTLINPLRLRKAEPQTYFEPQRLLVRHKAAGIRRMREVRGIAQSVRQDIDVARIGTQSTEFDEIREYQVGDPLKSINWKATARHSTGTRIQPLVNRYEPEGKKAVYFFLDAATYMQAGSTLENTFEATVKATTGVIKFFIDKGYKIGGQFFNARQNVAVYPDLGQRQYYKIARELSQLEAGEPQPEALQRAAEESKVHLIRMRPVSIVITRPEIDFESTLRGLKALRRYTTTGTRVRPILIINPLVYSAIAGSDEFANWTMLMLKAENRARYQTLRRMGMSVVDWDPKKEDIGVRLLRQVRTR